MQIRIDNEPVVSVGELNLVLSKVKDRGLVEITFSRKIQKIDIAFIAGLILCNRKWDVKFIVNCNHEIDKIFEIRQYLRQYEEIYGRKWTDVISSFKGIQNTSEKDFVASESFVPIFLINAESINEIFGNFDKDLFSRGIVEIWNKYVDKIQGKNHAESEYLDSKESILNTIKKSSPIQLFTFFVLYQKISPFKSNKDVHVQIQRTNELWEFVKGYTKGLHELAKNIIEHSTTKEGIITIRAYDDAENYQSKTSDKVLETHVFDFGDEGIIESLRRHTQNAQDHSKVYGEDIEILSGKFTLRDFIKPTIGTKLNQQLYRDLAHYGLMKFYKLIERNEGVVISSTCGEINTRDTYSSNEHYKHKAIQFGTAHYFQLPFKHELFKTQVYKGFIGNLKSSAQTITALSEIMNISVMDVAKLRITDVNKEKRLLLNFEPNTVIKNRVDEASFFKIFTTLKDRIDINYSAINMKSVSISSSSLLRFLAHLSGNYQQSIIIYNLRFEIYEEMLEENAHFYETLTDLTNGIPYWYENVGILVFTKIDKPSFNFADILFGANSADFRSINYTVSHTFPNSDSVLNDKTDNNVEFQIPPCLHSFFYKSSLLPFDLLLFNEGGKTLFQTNLEVLINQELKVDSHE